MDARVAARGMLYAFSVAGLIRLESVARGIIRISILLVRRVVRHALANVVVSRYVIRTISGPGQFARVG